MVGVIEDESQEEKWKDGLELKVDEGKEHGRKNAGEPKRPGFGESAVDEPTEKELFEQGGKDGDNEKGDREANGIVTKEWKIGFLFAETREAETGVVQNGGNCEGNHQIESVTKQHGLYEQPRGDFFETEVTHGERVFIHYKEPEREKEHHKLNEVLNEESNGGMKALQSLRGLRNVFKYSGKTCEQGDAQRKNLKKIAELEWRQMNWARWLALYESFC